MSEFKSNVKNFQQQYEQVKDKLTNEEQTKNALIMPFFQMLGWNVFNPMEFMPEYTADVGIKKGEKVDYAILVNDEPVILIEAKSINEKLEKHDSQLFRYFGTTSSKFGILTNGRYYKFYTDLDEQNKMDSEPFLTIDIENIKDAQLSELSKFKKEQFDVDNIMSSAEELKYLNLTKEYLAQQFEETSDDLVRFFLDNVYNERKTSGNIEKFKPVLNKGLNQIVNEKVSDKLNKALNSENNISIGEHHTEDTNAGNVDSELLVDEEDDGIETTEEELEFYNIVKFILSDVIAPERIFYRDNRSYFNILIDDNIRKWVARLWVKKSGEMHVAFRDDTKVIINSPLELKQYSDKLIECVEEYKE